LPLLFLFSLTLRVFPDHGSCSTSWRFQTIAHAAATARSAGRRRGGSTTTGAIVTFADVIHPMTTTHEQRPRFHISAADVPLAGKSITIAQQKKTNFTENRSVKIIFHGKLTVRNTCV
jgi:hypothetical protein